ncbi:MAG: carbohydrate ABC transporter substrate-binding protein [Lachnospiraceae bacterium]|nr:carbohydrate ABC transporter substrate-binding protein [Lachnospiraceae bacterium]
MKKRKIAAILMTVVLAVGTLAGCGGGSSSSGGGSGDSSAEADSSDSGSGDAEGITIFNSKMEVQSQMEEMAEKYSEEKGVPVEVYYSSDTVAAHLATKYASNDPYTISMVDAKDVYSLAEEHALDLTGEGWVDKTTQAISIGDKVYGFPVCIEARGIIYNADAIKNITGEDFDPSSIKTKADFEDLCKTLVDGGMEAPTGVMKEDWSLGAHYLAQVYEEQDDPDAFIAGIKDGSVDLAKDEKYNSLMDTFDVLKDNNYAKDAAISAEREVTEQKLAEGEIAFMFGGNWDWSVLNAYDYTENMGMMPVPQDMEDDFSGKLVGGGSKYFFIDSSENTSETQQQEAKDFLNWLVDDEEGQSFIVNDCALVPAYSNITLEVADPLGKSVKEYTDDDLLVPNYNYLPDDHYSICGASFQKYLAGETDRDGLAKEITDYWGTAEVGEH